MSAITFTQLPRELRDMVWSAAAIVQYQHIADGSPNSCTTPGATERLRQAFVGYENLPQGIERQPLRVYVHENGGRVRLCVNEFQTLVNRLPIATVCTEARSHAIDFCHKQVDIVDLHHTMEPSDVGDEILEYVLQPTTVMVTNVYRPEDFWDDSRDFNSADHLVTIIDRIFGSCVEHIVLNPWFNSSNTLERIYWPHIGQTRDRKLMDCTFIDDPNHNRYTVFMTPDRTMHVKEELYYEDGFGLKELSHHLLKFHEILDACKQKQKLLRLRSFELQLHTYCWEEMLTHVRATVKDGVLWVNWSDFQSGFEHDFFTYEDVW